MCKHGNVFSLPVLIRPIGLTVKFACCKCGQHNATLTREFAFRLSESTNALFDFSGGYVVGVTPVPIPNTEVKPYGADGTARVTVWESRTPPGLIFKTPPFGRG